MDPLCLLCRLATSVPRPRLHTIHYSGVLASASPWRKRLFPQAPEPPPQATEQEPAALGEPGRPEHKDAYRPWAELLARSFAVDVLRCPRCQGRMKLLAIVKDPTRIVPYLTVEGEPTEAPPRSPRRGPPYGKSRVLRRQTLGEEDDAASHARGADEPA